MFFFFFFNDTATTEIYTLSLHDALPICAGRTTADEHRQHRDPRRRRRRLQPDRATQGEDDHPRSSVSDTRPSMHAAGRRCPDRPATSYGPWHEMSHGLSIAATFPPKRQMTEETIHMKAIAVTDQAAGTAGMKLAERPEPQAAINDVVVQVHASGFVPTELTWPPTWNDRRDHDRTPSIPGHELAGVVTALGYCTAGLSGGQRGLVLTGWDCGGILAGYAA